MQLEKLFCDLEHLYDEVRCLKTEKNEEELNEILTQIEQIQISIPISDEEKDKLTRLVEKKRGY